MSTFVRHLLSRRLPFLLVGILGLSVIYLYLHLDQINDQDFLEDNINLDIDQEEQHRHHADGTLTRTKFVAETRTIIETVTTTIAAPPASELESDSGMPSFCNSCGPEDILCQLYGEHNLARSRAYEGSNSRFRRIISNAMDGKPIKIGVLGGSVTKGQSLKNQELENWTSLYLKAWKELFPNSETVLINGAVGATTSDYYSACFAEHIDEDVDLVILELLINDRRAESDAIAYEWLTRALLALPRAPAVVNLHTVGLSFDLISTGGDVNTGTAAYYDCPIVSVRNMLVTHIYKNWELDEYYFGKMPDKITPDWRHMDNHGHKVMADVLIAYTQRQICAVERERRQPHVFLDRSKGLLPGTENLEEIPRLRLFQKYDRETVTGTVKPFCRSIRSKKNPLEYFDSKGWKVWTYEKRPDKPYLIANIPGSYVKFYVEVGVMGRVRITYLRSKTFGLGDVWCWIDDDRKGGTKIESWWKLEKLNITRTSVVSDKVTPGRHILTCEIVESTKDPGGGHEFRLIAIDSA